MNERPAKIGSLVPTRLTVGPGTSPLPVPSRRCRIALVAGSTDHLTQETVCLLRRRLGIASLIALLPLGFFLVLNLLHAEGMPRWSGPIDRAFHAAVTVIALGLALMLTMNERPAKIGSLVPTPLTVGPGTSPFPVPSRPCRIALVGVTALAPLLLTGIPALADDVLRPHLVTPLLTTAVLMLAGVAIAVFGSRRIHFLEREVSQARRLGQYRLVERLGAGGMGEVHLAEHVLLRRPCAVKVIHPAHAADATQLARFEREVRAMASLTHWNTVEVFDYGHTEDGTFYYVMEYLPGQDLETLVRNNGPLPAGRVIHLLRQVCGALREAHGVGMLHRDIKPSNVIACQRGGLHDVVKLLDFGLVHCLGQAARPAEAAGKLTLEGTILGSPPFMSPEQSRGKSDLDIRSDIYSVGGMAYFLLTGQPPFVRETTMELLIAHASERVAPLRTLRAEVPADLEAVVLRCLEKDRDKRFGNVEELERELAGCASAGEWKEEMAAEWWRNHGETVSIHSPEPAANEQQATVAASA
ncbi:MAG: serine/threonine protein kinase [Planctomycetes bacterium]|nr:serine/threonine protein kinase [Planctomycetota bacterium]